VLAADYAQFPFLSHVVLLLRQTVLALAGRFGGQTRVDYAKAEVGQRIAVSNPAAAPTSATKSQQIEKQIGRTEECDEHGSGGSAFSCDLRIDETRGQDERRDSIAHRIY
jgi:hypothetical protein